MQLGDFLNKLATKIGAQDDQDLVGLLSSSELAQAEISDELARRFDTGLMSLEGAKNDRDVLNHLKPIILKGVDDKFAALAEKFGITAEIAAEKSSYAKFDILERTLASKIEDLTKKAEGAGGKGENEAKLTKQIADLQKQLADLAASKDKELADFKAKTAKQEMDFLVNFELNGKRYANQDLGDTNIEIARALINKALGENGAVLVNEGGKLKLKQSGSTELDYYDESHKAVSFTDFVDRILAEKHLLEVSDDTDHGGSGGKLPSQQPTTVKLKSGAEVDTSKVDSACAASLADLEQ